MQKGLPGPGVLRAARALRLATRDGARALGLAGENGSLESGKRADVIVVRLDDLHLTPQHGDVVSAIVYAAQTADVTTVVIDGQLLLRDDRLLLLDEEQVLDDANREAGFLRERAVLLGRVAQ